MAVTVYGVVPATWDPRLDFLSAKQQLKIALEGAPAVAASPQPADAVLALLCANRLAFGWDIEVSAKTTASETATVVDLTAIGVTFPAGFQRVIEIDAFASGDAANETQFLRHVAHVSGGTTPILRLTQLTPGSTAGTPAQIPTNFLSSVSAGFVGNAVLLALSTNNVQVQVTSGEAEIVDFFLRIKVGRLQPVLLGI